MSDLASSNDVATNGVNGRIDNKFWCKCECCAPMETSTEGVCCLEIHWDSQAKIYKYIVFVDQIHILCYDILGEKTSLVIWFPPNVHPCQIRIKVLYHFNFALLLNHIFFFVKEIFLCECIFSKEHPIGFMGSAIIEKQYCMIWIARSSHSHVLKNLLNGGKRYEIHFLGIWKKIFRTSIFWSTSVGLLLNIPETGSSLLWSFVFHFSFLWFRDRMYKSSRLQLLFKIGVLN